MKAWKRKDQMFLRAMKSLSDPHLFNYLILAMFVLAALRWTWAGNWGQALYWYSSATLTVAVTWGMRAN